MTRALPQTTSTQTSTSLLAYPIVIVDDLPANRTLLERLLEKAGYEHIYSYPSAVAMLADLTADQVSPGLILMDILMPDLNGIEALRQMQQDERLRDIPVIMVTAHKEDVYLSEAFAEGAMDFIHKPINRTELLARVHATLRLKQEMDLRKARERELLTAKQKLEKANQELKRLAIEDGLTGLANRRHFQEQLEKEWRRHLREERPLGLIMLDVDYFKRYNDTYGHQKGDQCLQIIASVLKAVAHRPGDVAARYGGEEFALLLPNTEPQGVHYLARLINKRVIQKQIPHKASEVADVVTVSVGGTVSFWNEQHSVENFVRTADEALYQAKKNGRNQVTFLPLESPSI